MSGSEVTVSSESEDWFSTMHFTLSNEFCTMVIEGISSRKGREVV
jgi:hypothetical protein